jgi:hypothetical protein
MNRILTLLFLLGAQTVAADDLTIPNAFTAGTPARAAEVNDNFTAVEASVDDNAADIATNSTDNATNTTDIATNTADITINAGDIATNAVGVQSNAAAITTNDLAIQDNSDAIAAVAVTGPVMIKVDGQNIGTFLQSNGDLFVEGDFWGLSDTGYLFNVTPFSINSRVIRDLRADRIGFTGPNCTGRSFVPTSGLERRALFFSGFVFASENLNDPNPAYYSPTNSPTLVDVLQESRTSSTGCEPGVGVMTFAVEVFPNVELITGVANQRNLGSPITLGR